MAKVSIKSEKVTPFGGIFHVRELFSRYMAPIIDKVLGQDVNRIYWRAHIFHTFLYTSWPYK